MPKETIEMTALQFMKLYMDLPNPERWLQSSMHRHQKIRVMFIPDPVLPAWGPTFPDKAHINAHQIEFTLHFDKPLPYWVPTQPIHIIHHESY